MSRTIFLIFALTLSAFALLADSPAPDKLTVHEWGTFTVLQDDDGRALPGINVDDEPLPDFVHRLAGGLVVTPTDLAPVYQKGVNHGYRRVTMRLETPVLYFYPPKAARLPLTLDVSVQFRGGWLTEFYPHGDAGGTGIERSKQGWVEFNNLTPKTLGTLDWKNIQVGTQGTPPPTDSRVWLAPRDVDAAPLSTSDSSESERYLFYRGVGNLDAPIRVTRDSNQLRVASPFPIADLWLVDIRPDASLAFRPLAALKENATSKTAAGFDESDYSPARLGELRTSMRAALVREGLYEKEADAMLNTWQAAYFQSPGLRVFYTVPRAWTDATLPLHVSQPAQVIRVMIGRVELVSPRQRDLLQRISKGPSSDPKWFFEAIEARAKAGDTRTISDVLAGRAPISKLNNLNPPDDYRAYIQLGRFRNALLLQELSRRPTDPLRSFVEDYNITYSK